MLGLKIVEISDMLFFKKKLMNTLTQYCVVIFLSTKKFVLGTSSENYYLSRSRKNFKPYTIMAKMIRVTD